MKKDNTLFDYLRIVKNKKKKVNVFLTSGIKLSGIIHSFDDRCVVMRSDSDMLIMIHSISTIVPMTQSFILQRNDTSHDEEFEDDNEETDDGWRR